MGDNFSQQEVNTQRVQYVNTVGNVSFDGFDFVVDDGGMFGSQPAGGSFTLALNSPGDVITQLSLNEGSGLVAGDAGGAGNDGSLLDGAVFDADTPDGSAFSVRLDGTNDSIDLGTLDVNGNGLTLAMWFKASSFATEDARLISKASGSGANDHVFMLSTVRTSGGIRLRARVRSGGTTTTLVATGGQPSVGQWHHAAVSFDGSFLRIHLDGLEIVSTPLSGSVDVDPGISVSVGSQPSGAGTSRFHGLVDDVRILQRAMSTAEIAAIAQ